MISRRRLYRYAIAILIALVFVLIWTFTQQGSIEKNHFGFSRLSLELFLVAVVLYPICEEIIFRGTIQAELFKRIMPMRRSFMSISLANLLTSLIFALTHALYFENLLALMVFFPSLVFGYFYEKEKHVIASIFIHSAYNFIGLLGTASF